MKALVLKPALILAMGCLAVVPQTVPAGDTDEYIDLTAHGNAPDWTLEIIKKGRRINFQTEGGAGSYKYATLGPSLYREEKTTLFNVLHDDHAMRVFVKGNACQDSVTGKLYETTVIVAYDGLGYYGCGDVTAD
ncbi:MAG: hypothetical protein PVF08_08910 [Gammaproteobacteria bacterium]|jgi:uncharacterized membrane protein